MADNYLEKQYEDYERKKTEYLKRKKLGLPPKRKKTKGRIGALSLCLPKYIGRMKNGKTF